MGKDVFERRWSTGSLFFCILWQWFCSHFRANRLYIVKEASKTNLTASRHIIKERTSLPVVVGRSKTPLLKLPTSNVRGGILFARFDVHQVQLSSVTWMLEAGKKKDGGVRWRFSIFPLSPFRSPLLIIFISLQYPMGASSGIHDEIAVRGSELVLLDG